MELLNPILYLVIAFSLNATLFLFRRRLPWDWPMILVLLSILGSAITAIIQGYNGVLLGLITFLVGIFIAEVGGRLGKHAQWNRIQGEYRKAYRKSFLTFLVQPTAYNRTLSQMMKLVVQVKEHGLTYEDAQEQLRKHQATLERIPNASIHMALWESLYAFAAVQSDWPKLVRNYNPELHPVYCNPPSGAGFYMVQALCEEGDYLKAGAILQEMQQSVTLSRMIPEESEVFHAKARLVWLAHLGYADSVKDLLAKGSALHNIFPKRERRKLIDTAEQANNLEVLHQIQALASFQEASALPPSDKDEWETEESEPKQVTDHRAAGAALKEAEPEPESRAWTKVEPEPRSQESTPTPTEAEPLLSEEEESLDSREMPQTLTPQDVSRLAQDSLSVLEIETRLAHDFVLLGSLTPVTKWMLGINLIIFLLMSLPGSYEGLLQLLYSLGFKTQDASHLWQYGACFSGCWHIGEGWRLISGNFQHATIVHIGFNSYFLLFFGPMVERFLGPWRFANVYLLSGVAGFFVALMFEPNTVLVGASASIFGVFGGSFLVIWLHRHDIPSSWFRRKMIVGVVLFVLNLYIGFAVKVVSLSAHMGGFLVGALATFVLLWSSQRAPQSLRKAGVAATLLLWVPLFLWTGERVYTTSQQPLLTRLKRLQKLGSQSVPILLAFRETSKSKAKLIDRQLKAMGSTGKQGLLKLLRKGRMQSLAAEILGQPIWKPREVVPALYAQLLRSKVDLQISILFALHWHQFAGLTPKQIQHTVRIILKRTHKSNAWARKNSLRLIFHLGPWAHAAIPVLQDALRTQPDSKVRSIVKLALVRLTGTRWKTLR